MPKTSPRHRPVRQEMKWGVFFVIWKMGEMLFVKKWTFHQRRVHYVQYQYFLFGGAYAPNAPPACGSATSCTTNPNLIRNNSTLRNDSTSIGYNKSNEWKLSITK